MNGSVTRLPIDEIVADDRYQPRCDGLCEEHIVAMMETPEAWPPICVAHVEGDHILIDGRHRFEAARRLGLASIDASIFYPDTNADLLGIAFSLNSTHGLPFTLTDRKAEAQRQLREHAELSDRAIGRVTGLHHETVGALRNGRSASGVDERKPGQLPDAVGLVDPIRFGKRATKEQKSIAGYVARLKIALADPYEDRTSLEAWSDDPADIARACVAAMGPKRALETLLGIETDARFMLSVVKAARTFAKEAS